MKIPFLKITTLFLLIFLPGQALAERPFLTIETAIPTEKDTYRIESGLVLNRLSARGKKTQLGLNIRYGLIQNLEFDLETPVLFLRGEGKSKNMLGDILLKTKIRFIKGRAANPLSIAGQMVIKFPAAGKEDFKEDILKTSGVVDVGFVALASKTFVPATAHINLGYYFIGNPAGKDLSDQVRYALGLESEVEGSPLKLIAELFGQSDTSSSSSTADTLVLMGGFALRTR
ncbi:MAG: hypothetical protein ACE5F7_09820, partial [Nitrospiria bacterium]